MKRVLILFLVAAFLISVWGCVAKTKYDGLLEEKAALEKKSEELSAKETELRSEITTRQKDIRGLRMELKQAKTSIRSLERKIAEEKAKSE